MFEHLGIEKKKEVKTITLEEVITKMKAKEYKRVVVLTGAGLSVAAGIPDFRSPGTGLYSKLEKYNLPYPEAIFEITYYKKNPKAFLTLSKELLTEQYKPTLGHKFIVKLNEEGLLHMNLTQNIDDLEITAGLPEDKILQAHGHSRSAHCIDCAKEADIKKWKELAAQEEPMKCQECETGLVKPDIVFFGEQLPKEFFNAPKIVGEADLAIIIGTSLKVMPFAYMAELIPPTSPVILINRDDVLPQRDYKIWLEGDIQENIQDLMTRLGWL